MKDRVKRYKIYAAWEYEKEEKELDEASKKGLQLIKGGCFHSEFKRDNSVRYIYQLDYNTGIKDFARYKEIFEEQGWEYINSTFNGWHYFRKPYKENMEEYEKKIYTDTESLNEMQNRWLSIMQILAGIYAVMTIVYLINGATQSLSSLFIEGIMFGLLSITMGLGARSIKRKRAGKESGFTLPLQWILLIAIILLVGIIPFML